MRDAALDVVAGLPLLLPPRDVEILYVPGVVCPGPEPVYLGRIFESPDLVFMRSLET
jgi:hypothetical protein